jgi:hypothetical protein
MKRTKRSVWHDRDVVVLASQRGRPRSCPQWLWHWTTPKREDGSVRTRANGWSGGRDRDKPRKSWYRLHARARSLGGIAQYDLRGPWTAYVVEDGLVTTVMPRAFVRRCAAKRWVEVESARRSAR